MCLVAHSKHHASGPQVFDDPVHRLRDRQGATEWDRKRRMKKLIKMKRKQPLIPPLKKRSKKKKPGEKSVNVDFEVCGLNILNKITHPYPSERSTAENVFQEYQRHSLVPVYRRRKGLHPWPSGDPDCRPHVEGPHGRRLLREGAIDYP